MASQLGIHTTFLPQRRATGSGQREGCDDPRCPVDQMVASSANAWLDGQLAKSMEQAEVAADANLLVCARGDCTQMAQVWRASLLTHVCDLSRGAEVLARAVPQSRDEGWDRVRAAAMLCRSEIDFIAGRLDEAVTRAQEGLRLADRAGVHVLLPVGHALLTLSALRRGDLGAVGHYANQLKDDALLGYARYMSGRCAWVVAQVIQARDGVGGVAHLIEGIVIDDRLSRELLAAQPAAAAWLVRVACDLDDDRLAARVVDHARYLSARNRSFGALHASALHAAGVFERNADQLLSAADLHLDRWAEASALEDAGRLLMHRATERDRAIDTLGRAADAYQTVGASRDMFRVVSVLRDVGVRRGWASRGAITRGAESAGQLTETEFAVADLVSRGFTNARVGQQLFISTHTVASHLKKIFRKLDIASRVELASVWATSGTRPDRAARSEPPSVFPAEMRQTSRAS